MPQFSQIVQGRLPSGGSGFATMICPMKKDDTSTTDLSDQVCATLPFGERVGVETHEFDGKKFLVIGPLRPLSGYAVSNFFNREFFHLDPAWSDLYLAQTRQREITHENSFVVKNGGENVYLRVGDIADYDGLFEFIKKRYEDIVFVLKNPEIDRFLRNRNFIDARNSLLAIQKPSSTR
ncbi:MAG: hypothetical protein AAGF30_05150 [Pseudomonadota bacterium]